MSCVYEVDGFPYGIFLFHLKFDLDFFGGSLSFWVKNYRFLDESVDWAESNGAIDLTCEESTEFRKKRDVTSDPGDLCFSLSFMLC